MHSWNVQRYFHVSWLKRCKDEALLYLPLQHCKSYDQTLSCYGLFTTWLIPLMSSHSCLVDVMDPSACYYPVLNHVNSQQMVSYWWIQWSEFTVWTQVSCQGVSPTNGLGTRLYHHMLKWLSFTGLLKFQCKQFVIWSYLITVQRWNTEWKRVHIHTCMCIKPRGVSTCDY